MKAKRTGPVVLAAAILTIGGALLVRSLNPPPDQEISSSNSAGEQFPEHRPLSKPSTVTRDEGVTEFSPGPVGELVVRVTADGMGVSEARIVALFPVARLRQEAVTDAEGLVRFSGIPIGEWGVGVRHLNYVPAGSDAEVREGKSTEVKIELRPGALLHGRVTDLQGTGIPEVKVYLCNTGEQITPLGQGLEAKTDETGSYRIDGIPIRGVVVIFTSNRHKPHQDQHDFRFAGEQVELNAQLLEGNLIRGRVIDEGGIPLPDVALTAGNEHAKATRTNDEGRFTIYGLGENEVHLSARKKGFGTIYVHDIAPNTLDLVIRLPRAGSLRGNIMADSPPPWFAVNLWRFDPYYEKNVRVKSVTFEGGTNTFLMPNVTPGEYTLKVLAPGYLLDNPIPVTVAGGRETSGILVPLRKE